MSASETPEREQAPKKKKKAKSWSTTGELLTLVFGHLPPSRIYAFGGGVVVIVGSVGTIGYGIGHHVPSVQLEACRSELETQKDANQKNICIPMVAHQTDRNARRVQESAAKLAKHLEAFRLSAEQIDAGVFWSADVQRLDMDKHIFLLEGDEVASDLTAAIVSHVDMLNNMSKRMRDRSILPLTNGRAAMQEDDVRFEAARQETAVLVDKLTSHMQQKYGQAELVIQ